MPSSSLEIQFGRYLRVSAILIMASIASSSAAAQGTPAGSAKDPAPAGAERKLAMAAVRRQLPIVCLALGSWMLKAARTQVAKKLIDATTGYNAQTPTGAKYAAQLQEQRDLKAEVASMDAAIGTLDDERNQRAAKCGGDHECQVNAGTKGLFGTTGPNDLPLTATQSMKMFMLPTAADSLKALSCPATLAAFRD